MESTKLGIVSSQRGIGVSARKLYLGMAAALLIWMTWSSFCFPLPTFSPGEDFWEHAAALREWTSDISDPGNPHFATEDPSRQYIPLYFLLALVGRLLDIGPVELMGLAAVLNTALLLTGIFLFFREYFDHDYAPSVGLVVMLFGWGVGWRVSSVYQLRSLFYVAGYPSMCAFALTLISFWLVTRALRQRWPVGRVVACVALFTAVIVLSHQVVAAFAISGICLLALTERDVSVRGRSAVLAALPLGLATTALWPFFSVAGLLLGSSSDYPDLPSLLTEAREWLETDSSLEPDRPYAYDYNWMAALRVGPALLGVPCIVFLALRRLHTFVVAGFCLMMTPYIAYLVSPVSFEWLGVRFLYRSVFFAHMALTAVILDRLAVWRALLSQRRMPPIAASLAIGAIALAVLLNGAAAAGQFVYTYLFKESVVEVMERLAPHFSEGSIVLAPQTMAWPIPAFSAKIVSTLHPNHLARDTQQRADDAEGFFEAMTSDAERLETLRRYKVTHVLVDVDSTPQSVLSFLEAKSYTSAMVQGYTRPLKPGDNRLGPRQQIGIRVFTVASRSP